MLHCLLIKSIAHFSQDHYLITHALGLFWVFNAKQPKARVYWLLFWVESLEWDFLNLAHSLLISPEANYSPKALNLTNDSNRFRNVTLLSKLLAVIVFAFAHDLVISSMTVQYYPTNTVQYQTDQSQLGPSDIFHFFLGGAQEIFLGLHSISWAPLNDYFFGLDLSFISL